jgi:hypothetical protein
MFPSSADQSLSAKVPSKRFRRILEPSSGRSDQDRPTRLDDCTSAGFVAAEVDQTTEKEADEKPHLRREPRPWSLNGSSIGHRGAGGRIGLLACPSGLQEPGPNRTCGHLWGLERLLMGLSRLAD